MPDSIGSKVALITGASSQIGQAIALGLAEDGYHLVLLSRNPAELNKLAQQCQAQNQVQTLPLSVDITDSKALENAVQQIVAQFGKLDLLVNAAGIFDWNSAFDADPKVWHNLIEVNLQAAIHVTLLTLPLIRQSEGGAVIFIASMAAKFAFGMNASYVASKHGLLGFAGSVFEDVRNDNIKVCSICPGLVNAGATLGLNLDGAKLIQPQDVAETVRFVLNFPANACPTEIVLQPQLNPFTGS